ncbi:translocation and assembly module lipoprotein TamL [Cesiribacter andamanensis]|uniref:Outer membrane protein/protective antigen OMA87 n=1 Tax=Cesiribacter andamanensis AMV16 TaxID=1279009 RepID=M7NAV5_9BACT|nr:BamA/TamA family outer membrane protein [Cesiribacter andamanensis]EMR04301.1 Outer membrane protein/protective antigen OMA87 [Cesiribacter andamanensis AMV16]
MTRKYCFLPAFGRLLLIFFSLTLLQACLGIKHLEENEYLLYQQSIEGNNTIADDELDDFYRQEANVRTPLIPWAPYVSIYYLGENFYNPDKLRRKREETIQKFDERIAEAAAEGKERRRDRLQAKKESKLEKINRNLEEGNMLMRIGEPVTVYDSTLASQSADQMQQYLHNKGFFNAATRYTSDTTDRKVNVTYHITENREYLVDTAWLKVTNQQIRQLMLDHIDQSYLLKKKRYDQADLSSERNRINELMRNNGYYEFSPQYIEFNVDSTYGDHLVSIETEILRPADRGYHRQFTVDSVVFVTDATVRGDLEGRQNEVYNGVTYRFFEDRYSKKILNNRVFIRPDSLYSRQETMETQKQLANLDNFKFININYDTADGKFISYIYTNPLKRFQTSNELGLTYSIGVPGPFFTSTWTMRNVFGGLENLEFNVRAALEGVPSPTDPNTPFTSRQFGGNLSLIFPQFLAPLSERRRNYLGHFNPKTRMLLGVNFTDRGEFTRNSFNTSLLYSWQTEKRNRGNFYNNLYTIAPIDINLIQSEFSGDRETNRFYQRLLEWRDQGNPYIYSFTSSFVSSIYGFAVLNKNNYGTYLERSRYIRPYIESGGTTQNLFDFGFIRDGGLLGGDSLATFRFLKFSNDYRQFIPLKGKNAIAWRINAGVAIPYGSGGQDEAGNPIQATLPYEKFFFAGGSNSIRAFRPRRLGPGVYTPDPEYQVDGNSYTNLIEQPGEVILEASIEHRHNIFGFLNGALFLDAGNVWRLREAAAQPGSRFEASQFYRQIALGSGYGVRLDFSFLIIRFDLGFKLYNPQAVTPLGGGEFDYSTGWIFNKQYGAGAEELSFWDKDPIILNIGIGYPF